MSGEKITQTELTNWFGPKLPVEVYKLLFEAPEDMTIGEIRAKVRAEADKVTDPMFLLEAADDMLRVVSGNDYFPSDDFALWQSRLGILRRRKHDESRSVLGLDS